MSSQTRLKIEKDIRTKFANQVQGVKHKFDS